jgi:hypothetical protein
MKNAAYAVQIAAAAVLAASLAPSGRAQSLFATLSVPGGIVTDAQGNLFVEHGTTNPFAPMQTTKYQPTGVVMGNYTTGGLNGSRFALDPGVSALWAMDSSGQIRIMDPATGASGNYFSLRQIPIDTSHIYDVNIDQVRDFCGIIKTYSSWYGDIAVLRRGSRLDVFVSGVSDLGSIPFVIRIHMLPAPAYAQMIVASSASSLPVTCYSGACGSQGRPYGIAVSPNGTVLTTLPLNNGKGGNPPFAFTFSADFDPVTAVNPPRAILGGLNGKGFGSNGMASDNSGRFFVAADLGTTTLYCPMTVAAGVLMLPASLDSVTCLGGLGAVTDETRDVAATPKGDAVYVTMTKLIGVQTNTGSVLKFTNFSSSPNCAVTLNPAGRAHGYGAESGTIAVTATGGCTWAASAGASWITITGGAAGTGNGTVSYAVEANPNNTARQAAITVSGKTFTVSQAAKPGASCTYSLGPASTYMYRAGGVGAVTLSTAAGCPWTATTDVPWISITSAKTGSGSATITYSVAANTENLTRVGWIKAGAASSQVSQFNF